VRQLFNGVAFTEGVGRGAMVEPESAGVAGHVACGGLAEACCLSDVTPVICDEVNTLSAS
jgi:hypothetical protein